MGSEPRAPRRLLTRNRGSRGFAFSGALAPAVQCAVGTNGDGRAPAEIRGKSLAYGAFSLARSVWGGAALTLRSRSISFAETVLGACIVVGHNVIHLLPNEVPILFVAFWISTRVRCGTWKPAALQRPQSWWKTALMALVAALVLQVGSELLVQPLASHFWPRPARVSSLLEAEAMGWPRALATLAVVWGFAAFGEEIGYRGYLLERIAHLGNRSRLAYVAAVALVAVLFGFGHFYKGAAGIADSTYSGLVLGGLYLVSGCNLWAPILAHGFSDTLAVAAVFFGLAN